MELKLLEIKNNMHLKIISLYKLLSSKQRSSLVKLQFFVVLMAFAEVVGVVAIGPFMAVVGDMQMLY